MNVQQRKLMQAELGKKLGKLNKGRKMKLSREEKRARSERMRKVATQYNSRVKEALELLNVCEKEMLAEQIKEGKQNGNGNVS